MLDVPRHPWAIWWELSKGEFVQPKTAVRRDGATTGSADFFLGEDDADERLPEARRIAPALVRERIVPALLAELQRPGGPDATIEALLALGRLAPGLTRAEFVPVQAALESRLGEGNRPIAEAATIALGATAKDSAVPVLAALLSDNSRGRELAAGAVPERQRAFAAYGLGAIARTSTREDVRRFAVGALARQLDESDRTHSDTQIACVLALGLVPLEQIVVRDPGGVPEPTSASRIAVVRRLEEMLGARRGLRLDVRAHVPIAFGRMAADLPMQRLDELKAWLAEPLLAAMPRVRREGAEVTRALASALGALGDGDADPLDVRVREAVIQLAGDSDVLTRYAALLALGEIAARPGLGSMPGRARDALMAPLFGELERGRAAAGPFAVTAVALAMRSMRDQGITPPAEWSAALARALEDAGSPEELVASCVAIGLAGENGLVAGVLAAFDRSPVGWERSQVALALGLLGEPTVRPILRTYAAASAPRSRDLRAAAEALVMSGDHAFATELASSLAGLRSQELQAAAHALGAIGEPQAVEPLLAALSSDNATSAVRASINQALGRIADPRPAFFLQDLARLVALLDTPPTLLSAQTLRAGLDQAQFMGALTNGGGLLNLLP